MEFKKLFSKENVAAATSTVKAGAKQNAPTLMLIGATIGLGLTIYEVLKAKPKCDDILAERKEKLEELESEVVDESAVDTESEEAEAEVKMVPKYTEEEKKLEKRKINIETALKLGGVLKKPFAIGATTVGLMWGANYIHIKRTRSLTKKLADATALYDISQEALKKYKGNTEEIVGKEKAEEIQKKTDEDICDDHKTRRVDYRYMHQLFYDKPRGKEFYSTIAQLENGVADVRMNFDIGEFIEANILYDNWGLDECGFGEKHGWMPGQIELYLKPLNESIVLPDGRSAIIVDYDYMEAPEYD